MLRRPWSPEDDQRLVELWPTHSAGVLAKMFGMSRNAIIGRAHRMKIDKLTGRCETIREPNKAVPWSEEADAFLRSQWGTLSLVDILRGLGEIGEHRTMSSLRHRVDRLGLTKISMTYARPPVDFGDRKVLTLKPVRRRKPPAPPPEPWTGPCISMLDDKLSHFMCREIVRGSGVDTMFCGAPTVPGSQFSYCAFHASKNLRLATRKEDRPRFVPYRVAA